MLLGNLLSFYEQLRLFEEQGEALGPYHLEKPLWVFVGSTVNAVYTRQGQKRSDVLTVARFLQHVLQDRSWAVDTIKKLLKGKCGLVTTDGQDVFLGRFKHLRETGLTASRVYGDVLGCIFHAPTGGGLHLADIRGSAGELGLKAGGADAYFGVIYIGDTSTFKKLIEQDGAEITLEQDALSGSLFDGINWPDSQIHILIGAKKFTEGWNSWRVSNMGLLNIGRSEGSQIIQLFGRGVRLRGKGFSLKRSAALDGPHPEHISLLETLNIFAVRANYMAQFRNYLEREGVETEPVIELPLFTWINEVALEKNWCPRAYRTAASLLRKPTSCWNLIPNSASWWTCRFGCKRWKARCWSCIPCRCRPVRSDRFRMRAWRWWTGKRSIWTCWPTRRAKVGAI